MTEIEQLPTRVASEARLGFRLPLLLAALHLRRGDGGFGPVRGLPISHWGHTMDASLDCIRTTAQAS